MNHEQVIFDLQMAGYTGSWPTQNATPIGTATRAKFKALADKGIWVTVNAASLAGLTALKCTGSPMHCSKTAPPK